MADESQEMGGIHFPFPFPPYPIQKDFMAELYKVLEAGKIGIFESATGTFSNIGPNLRMFQKDVFLRRNEKWQCLIKAPGEEIYVNTLLVPTKPAYTF
ncbi:ATP-dependent DNA helicase DDX11-like, partial [Onychomys torridus]|uniref:ATP-dependent DNA helicase DDX11-like n=1 Tax=Onychomys torridus TaxID=38674 RepID=UPI00167FAEA3